MIGVRPGGEAGDFVAGEAEIAKHEFVLRKARLDKSFQPAVVLHPLGKGVADDADMIAFFEFKWGCNCRAGYKRREQRQERESQVLHGHFLDAEGSDGAFDGSVATDVLARPRRPINHTARAASATIVQTNVTSACKIVAWRDGIIISAAKPQAIPIADIAN